MTKKGNRWCCSLLEVSIGVLILTGISGYAGTAGDTLLPAETAMKELGPFDLRGYGRVSAEGNLWRGKEGDTALVRFHCQDAESAKILASKYLADIWHTGRRQVASISKPCLSASVIQNIVNVAGKLVNTGGHTMLKISRKCPWFDPFERLFASYC